MTSPITRFAARVLFLPVWMVSFAVLLKGYADIGDGFSAGVIASLGVISTPAWCQLGSQMVMSGIGRHRADRYQKSKLGSSLAVSSR